MVRLAVVEEYKLKNCTVSIHDDAFAEVSGKEMERRLAEMRREAWRIWEAAQLRKQAGGTEQPEACTG